jgi:hypothetical protein
MNGRNMTKEQIYQAFVRHWNSIGIRRHGWIADPNQIGPVTRQRNYERNHNSHTGKPQATASVVPGAHFRTCYRGK